jgi:hypothetical protein
MESYMNAVKRTVLSIDQDSTVRATLKKNVNQYKPDFDFMFSNGVTKITKAYLKQKHAKS